MIFDTHCHYNLSPLYENWQEHWQKAQAHGVKKSLIVGAGINSSKKAIEVASQDPNLYAAIGKHPDVYRKAVDNKLKEKGDWQDVMADIEDDIETLEKMIKDNPEVVVAIGEVGLDYYRMREKGDKREWMIAVQKRAFEAQLKLALEYDLPVVVHVRDKDDQHQANYDAFVIIKKIMDQHKDVSPLRFVLHCVAGPEDYINEALRMGGLIGIDGNATYVGSENKTPLNMIDQIPPEQILIETDAPYLAPLDYKQGICEPWMVSLVAEFLEDSFGVSQDRCYENACGFFRV